MRVSSAVLALVFVIACGGKSGGGGVDAGGGGDGGNLPDSCVGLECRIVDCAKDGKPPTALTGTVHAPNGTLPLYGVNVYIPRAPAPLPPLPDGVQCSRCSQELPGSPLTSIQTDELGRFRLENVPSGDNIPIVITTGKWRRQLTIPRVESCADTALPMADTRLPRTKAEGEIPKIALTTGLGDSLECLVRKLGIDDSEVTTDAGTGRVHFFHGHGPLTRLGNGNVTLPNATTLWATPAKLRQYDMVFLSCEGYQRPETKPLESMLAVKAYADAGGRVFASHWHNLWIGGAFLSDGARPPVWDALATWRSDDNNGDPGNPILIDQVSNPKGRAFARWMVNVKGSGPALDTGVGPDTTEGQIAIEGGTGRVSALTLTDPTRVERWVYTADDLRPQMFQFTTPNEAPEIERCGKVVFTDMHVSGGPDESINSYPAACQETSLTPQEKALAFMFFDIASCVGPIL